MAGGLQQGIRAVFEDIQATDFHATQREFPLETQLTRSGQVSARRRRMVHRPMSDARLGVSLTLLMALTPSRLPILTNVEFTTMSLDRRYGLVVHARADAPPGRSRVSSLKGRTDYWQQSKRMPQGGLVALVTKYKHGEPQLAIGLLTTSERPPCSILITSDFQVCSFAP